MIVIDTHVHLLVSKAAPPLWEEISFTADVARQDGLDVICITEHLDAQYYPDLVHGIFLEGKLGGELRAPGVVRLENGLILSSGAEIALCGGGDVGVHAAPEILLALRREKGSYGLGELLATLPTESNALAVVAHHYYWPGKCIAGLADYTDRIHAIEMPAKDLDNAQRYSDLAERLNLALVGGSDAHTWLQVGSCRSDGDLDVAETFDPEHLRSMMIRRALQVRPLPAAAERIRMSKIFRTRLESQYARVGVNLRIG